jgi:ABC-type multidrug transport system fused ATPase/permease subunit
MKYFSWLWNNSRGIRWNTVVRIIAGIIQVVLSLLMVWLSKRFIDETTERELYHRLFKTYPQKTMLFITHRKAVSELCDEVVCL